MIDNFKLIKPLFYFNEANKMFFHCQIMTRNKDHKDDNIKERLISTYIIRSREQLDVLKEEIVQLCEHHKARAYISVAGKDFNTVNKLMLCKLAGYNLNDDLGINPQKILDSAIGCTNSREHRWIVDVDNISQAKDILLWLDCYFNIVYHDEESRCEYLYATIPTKSGIHYITKPFNSQEFNKAFPNVDIHKNNLTVLYIPKSLDNEINKK